jgi:hypothetical protein
LAFGVQRLAFTGAFDSNVEQEETVCFAGGDAERRIFAKMREIQVH